MKSLFDLLIQLCKTGRQAGSLPTAARSLHRLCSFPWLIIAVSVARRMKRAWRMQSWMENVRDRW